MECVLGQNGMRFGPKWNAFWAKTENAYAQYALHYPHDYYKMLALVIPKNNIFFAITSAFQHYLLSLQANNSS